MDDLTLLTTLARDLDTGFEALALAYQRRLYGLALRLTTRSFANDFCRHTCRIDSFLRKRRFLTSCNCAAPGESLDGCLTGTLSSYTL